MAELARAAHACKELNSLPLLCLPLASNDHNEEQLAKNVPKLETCFCRNVVNDFTLSPDCPRCPSVSASPSSVRSTGGGERRSQRPKHRGLRGPLEKRKCESFYSCLKQSRMVLTAIFLFLALYFQSLVSLECCIIFLPLGRGLRKKKKI